MTLRAQLIKEIIIKIDQIPESKLKKLLEFLEADKNFIEEKKAILGFAGSWKDMDKSTFRDLTSQLHSNRQKDNRAID